MQADPLRNVVAFTLKNETAPRIGQGAAKDPACVREAWESATKQKPANAADVSEIFCDWQPSPEDRAWIDATFPADARLSFNFKRPTTDDEWTTALAEAKKALEEAIAADIAEHAKDAKEQFVLPVLTSFETDKPLPDTFVTKPVVPGLSVVLARVTPTPQKTFNVHWITKQELKDRKEESFTLWKKSWENIEKDLKFGANKENDVFVLNHDKGLGAGVIAMPGFNEQAAGWVKSKKVTISIPNPSGLLVAATGTSASKQATIAAMESPYTASGATAFTPCVLELTFGTLKMVAQRGKNPPTPPAK